MRYDYIVLEGYCEKNEGADFTGKPCQEEQGKLGAHCVECDLFSSHKSENSLVYTNERGVSEGRRDRVQFNLELDTFDEDVKQIEELQELWNMVCRKKIAEVYDEYMELKSKRK